MKRKKKAFSRDERKRHVLGQFVIWRDNGDHEPKTMYRIARSLDMTPTKHVADILLEMVVSGDLVVEERDQSGRWTTRFYALSETRALSRVVSKRRISVKHKGVVSAQLELWS